MPDKSAAEMAFDSALQHAINADKLARDDPAHAASELAKATQALIKATQMQLKTIEDGISGLRDRR